MTAFKLNQRPVRRWWLIGTALAAAAAFAVVFVAGSDATPTTAAALATTDCNGNASSANLLAGSNFEIDQASGAGTKQSPFTGGANLKVDHSPCIDWATTASGTPASVFTSGIAKQDKPTGSSDDSFGRGTSENDANPAIVAGSIPPQKSDLQAFGVYKETTASGKFLDLFWSRVNSPQGTTVMDFELNKLACSGVASDANCAVNTASDPDPSNPGHPLAEVPNRSTGDKLISYVFSGSATPTVCLYNWNGSSWDQPGIQISSGAITTDCGNNATQLNGDALGAINFSSIPSADSFGLGDVTALSFGEVAVNFNAIFPPGGACGAFGSVRLSSRSSATFSSEVKDFVAPENVLITNCTTLSTKVLSKTPASPGTVGDALSDTATLSNAQGPTNGVVFKAYGPFDLNSSASGDTCVDSGTGANLVYTSSEITLIGPDANGDYTAAVPTTGTGTFVPTAAGRYQWVAYYAADANNGASSSKCLDPNEASAVQAAPGIATTLSCVATSSCSTIAVNGSVSDSASLSSTSGFRPTGTVTYTVYTENTCTTAATVDTNGQIDAQPAQVTLTASGTPLVPNSGSVTFHAPHAYWWQAAYSGDGNNKSATSTCSSEPMTVVQSPSTISTTQTWVPQDTATIDHSGGSVVFSLFKNDNTCSVAANKVFGTAAISVVGTGAGGTAPFQASTSNSGSASTTPPGFSVSSVTANATDKYYWKAEYTSGDALHKNVTENCTEVTTFSALTNGSSTTSS